MSEQNSPQESENKQVASIVDFAALQDALRSASEPEKKLELAIQFMQERLAQTGVPHFKEFWDARRLCLDLFKENINPTSRVNLWALYSELCREARKLKEIFDEQSAFAAEQIEIAVAAIEQDIAKFPELLKEVPEVDFGQEIPCLRDHMAEYSSYQKELNLLNTYATRCSQLRKELIKTEMRIRQKNAFFERLSKIGDAIFPRRKELIQKVSELFTSDIETFIKTTFVSELKTVQLFSARDEIKELQNIAKVLTLNTEAFSSTRKTLSECWDSIKNVVKERKKESHDQKAAFKKHRDEFAQELDALKASVEAKEQPVASLDKKLEDISNRMRNTTLGKLEIRELRDMVREIRQKIQDMSHSEDKERRELAHKKEQEKKEALNELRKKLENLLESQDEPEIVDAALEPLVKEVGQLIANRTEKKELESLVRNIKDSIADKKEQKLLSMSADDREKVQALKNLLKEKKRTRQEIKTQLDAMRKVSGSSGLDFAVAFQYNDMILDEKVRLEKVEASIEELEEMIQKLQGR